MWDVKELTFSVAITVWFSCNLGRFWSHALLQKKKDGEEKELQEIAKIDLSQTGWVLRSHFFPSPGRGNSFFHWYISTPAVGW